ncbi:MAG: DNA polymerase III subunit alpha [Propionibacteriales bacterium]|nr:DNA polymerase III subunit alpha [Propionibacteriales bacterium]
MDPFVHLHVASGYSLKYGGSSPARLVEQAADADMDTLALTDRDGMYGAIRFVKACMTRGIRPLLGVDLAIEPAGLMRPPAGSRGTPGAGLSKAFATQKSADRRPAARVSPARGGTYRDPALPRVTLLAASKAGWAALCRLVSATHLRGERGAPVTTQQLIAESLSGLASGSDLIVLLGPTSELGWAATLRREDLARAVLRSWRDIADPTNLLVEVVSHRVAGAGPGSSPHAARMAGVAAATGYGLVLTNAVRYADRSDALTVDVLDAVRRLVPLDSRHVDRTNAEGYVKSGKEMADIADEICRLAGLAPHAADALLAHTRTVADRCALDPRADLGLGEVHLPELDVIGTAGVADLAGVDLSTRSPAFGDAVLRARCDAGIGRRYPVDQHSVVSARLADELAIIGELGYSSYFLTVADVVDLIRDLGVRAAARGSGAGSLVNYLLGISGVDPLRYGLLMERFLSPLRRALPDIDLDVESARRTEVYERILERYTSNRCVCVSMMDTYRVRHAIRDVGAALGLPPGEIDSIAKAFPHIRAKDARTALRELPELRASGLGDERFDVWFRLVEKLDGLPRHIAVHPCGVLLSDTTLLDRTPVEASYLGFPMSQFDKDDVEDLGLLKLDVLGIRMQSAMAHAIDEVRRVDGVDVDIDDERQAPRDDPATYALISSAKTLGCFQIESPGQRELVGKFGPETFDDIIIDISLFRPGPVKSDMVTPFLRARQGWSEPECLHPDLEPVLAQTCGVVVFHEQVIEMIAVLTGCTLAEADEARRALGDREGKHDMKIWFFPRVLARGYSTSLAQRCWEVLEAFASFGFCKAHAAAFALPTYQSAWLKAHHPAAFLAGVLTHDPGMYPKRLILDDARQLGIAVLPLDVNASDVVYRVERVAPDIKGGYGIRLSLADVKGISDAEMARIVAVRPFSSLADMWQRARPSQPTAERLVLAGGLDSIYGIGAPGPVRRRGAVTRRDLLLQVVELDRWSRATGASAQLALLDDTPELTPGGGLPEMSGAERVRAELEILGLDVSAHVVDFYAPMLDALTVTWSRDLLGRRSRSELLVAGVKVATQTPPIRSGRRVIFLTLDDGTGPVDATFFEDAQGPYAATLFHSWLLVVRGELRRTGPRGVSLRATGCWELPLLHDIWQREGVPGVYDFMNQLPPGFAQGGLGSEQTVHGSAQSRSTRPVMASPPSSADEAAASTAGGMGRRRVLVHTSGFKQSPYADIRPAGDDPKAVPRNLWHRSPGSPG